MCCPGPPEVKIDRISVYQVDLPLTEPYWLSGGRLRFDVLDATLVRLDTDEGITGWGEGTPWGHTYVPAHGPGIRAGIETMADTILGCDPRQLDMLEHKMDLCLPGHGYAKAPIDLACWDITGQAAGLPIADLLGGRYDSGTWIASSISSGDPSYMLERILQYREMGYRVHSVKIGANVEKDIERVRFLEEHRLDEERYLYDVNRAWTRREAMLVMNSLAEQHITVEQPGESLEDLAAIRRQTRLPISIDESLVTLQDGVRVVREGIAEVFNIKINRVGGLTRARRLRDLALDYGIQMYIMATGGSVLADTEAAHLAQSIPDAFRLGTWACQDMLSRDIAPGQGVRSREGKLYVDKTPGHGVVPDEEQLGVPVAVYSL